MVPERLRATIMASLSIAIRAVRIGRVCSPTCHLFSISRPSEVARIISRMPVEIILLAWWLPGPADSSERTLSTSPFIRELPAPGNGHGEPPNRRHCPSEPSLSPRTPCCPSPPVRPLYPLPGGRSPLLYLPSSDAPVRPSHLPTVLVPLPRRAFPCLVALRAARYPPPGSDPVTLLPQGRLLPGKAERSGRYPRRGSRAVPSWFADQGPPRFGWRVRLRWSRLWPEGSWSERYSSRPPRSTPHSQNAS